MRSDRVARDLAEALRKASGGDANFVVDNVIGATQAAKATPDCHTRLLRHIDMASAPAPYRKLQ